MENNDEKVDLKELVASIGALVITLGVGVSVYKKSMYAKTRKWKKKFKNDLKGKR